MLYSVERNSDKSIQTLFTNTLAVFIRLDGASFFGGVATGFKALETGSLERQVNGCRGEIKVSCLCCERQSSTLRRGFFLLRLLLLWLLWFCLHFLSWWWCLLFITWTAKNGIKPYIILFNGTNRWKKIPLLFSGMLQHSGYMQPLTTVDAKEGHHRSFSRRLGLGLARSDHLCGLLGLFLFYHLRWGNIFN